jgi:hypothetical protein
MISAKKMTFFFSGSGITPTYQITNPQSGDTFAHEPDFWLHLANVTTPSDDNLNVKISMRVEDPDNQMRCNIFGDGRVYVMDVVEAAGVGSTLTNLGRFISDGQDVYLRVEGGSVRVWVDDVEMDAASGLDTYAHLSNGGFKTGAFAAGSAIGTLTTWPLAANLK